MATKKMNIQKPVELVPLSRNAAPAAMAPVTQQDPKRHCNGSCHQSIENRRQDGRRRVVCLAPEIEYHTEPNENRVIVTKTIVQKMASGFAWRRFSRSISE